MAPFVVQEGGKNYANPEFNSEIVQKYLLI